MTNFGAMGLGSQLAEPDLPPMLSGRRTIDGRSALDAAIEGAVSMTLGAGDLLWRDDPTVADIAIILEPDVSLAKASQLLPMTMVAVGDCVGALTPPQVGVLFRWPCHILINAAAAGRVRLVAGTGDPSAVPRWLVVGVELRLRHQAGALEPGHDREHTSLAEEGCEELTNIELVESCSRHFLTWLNIWQDDGFRSVHDSWLNRADGRQEAIAVEGIEHPVTVTGLDEDGNLLVKDRSGAVSTRALLDVVTVVDDNSSS
ncbi:MAG: biotin/lipoate--protein ligase family protein [Hyphomicrobiaceae bacterium]